MVVNAKKSPLVIFALDVGGLDPIVRGEAEGYLPTIGSIMRRGCWGEIVGPELICEYGCWLSLFSGISRIKHGYYYFRQLIPGTYNLRAFTPHETGVLPFWSHLHNSNKKVAVVDAPETSIVRDLPGIQLTNWATHLPPSAAITEPPELMIDVHQLFGPQMIIEEKFESSLQEDMEIYQRLLERIKKKGSLCLNLLSRDHFDLVVVAFSESHTANHQFWKYRPEAQIGEEEVGNSELTNAIRKVYQAIDRQMGLVLAQLPDDANVFFCSLLGMQDCYPTTELMEGFCRELGYHIPPPVSPNPLNLIRRIVPKAWRVALSRYVPRTGQEQLLANRLRSGTNWRETTAFAIPSWDEGFVRVNLKGREPEGIVEPGMDYETLLDRLEGDLMKLVDPKDGRPAVDQVVKTAEMFRNGPPVSLPDLFVSWKPTPYLMKRIVHPKATLVQQNFSCAGCEETMQCFFAAAGPSIQQQGPIGDVLVLDLAPTFFHLMGESIPQDFNGRVIKRMLKP
jgi:predicted AlkP superfamily phosphohydrolase/phosphomutase